MVCVGGGIDINRLARLPRVASVAWSAFSVFVLPEGCLISVLVDYVSQNTLEELLKVSETLASQK